MKILVVGGGGREHALTWCFARDGHEVIATPGNPGMQSIARCVDISASNIDGLVDLATREPPDLVVVGPEAPLVAGLADRLREHGIAVFGPGAAGAQLEGSKAFSKRFFQRHGIRTAEFSVCDSVDAADTAIARLGDEVVVKADGLAAGKGVVVCDNQQQARQAARDMLEGGRFGDAGKRIVIERRIRGRELSVMALTDGTRIEVLAQAEDHKAVFDGDRGPNTGGMGAVSPPSWADSALIERIKREVFEPTLRGLAAEGIDYRGVLYAGFFIDEDGLPWLLEYNCRFGDPETQPIVSRIKSDFAHWLVGAANGNLPAESVEWDPRCAVCVVMTAQGYPTQARKGDRIDGIDAAESAGAVVFQAGTVQSEGQLYTAGGRVLGVTSLGDTVAEARAAAYQAVQSIQFAGAHYRRDIGNRET